MISGTQPHIKEIKKVVEPVALKVDYKMTYNPISMIFTQRGSTIKGKLFCLKTTIIINRFHFI